MTDRLILRCLNLGLLLIASAGVSAKSEYQIMTVADPIAAEELGFTLTHEHIMSNFGQDPQRTGVYDEVALRAQVVPYLKSLRAQGVDTVVDCTTAYFGRNVTLLREFAAESGLQLVTNTGWYGAAKGRYIPERAFTLPADEIAAEWISEFTEGIDGTDVRPGFIKLAVNAGELHPVDRKLLESAALTHLATGMVIAVHTGKNSAAAKEQLTILEHAGVSPSAWIWTHAQHADSSAPLITAARRGAWISLDGVRENPAQQKPILSHLLALREAGLLSRVLLSHDGNGFPSGGSIRPFDALTSTFLPHLRELGFSEAEIKQLVITNPREAFSLRVRSK
jgi:predicted metal-dependent phosphotriesterase family hydrolase